MIFKCYFGNDIITTAIISSPAIDFHKLGKEGGGCINPYVYLAIDNCFASKRWTEPEDWMDVVKQLGLRFVEASADNECDPLYTTSEYLDDWTKAVEVASRKTDVRVCQFFSGHGTYATLGLSHPDQRIRERMLHDWLHPMCRLAGHFGANMGFYTHGMSIRTLEDPSQYREMAAHLEDAFVQLAIWGHECGCNSVGVEQMYSPHQPGLYSKIAVDGVLCAPRQRKHQEYGRDNPHFRNS